MSTAIFWPSDLISRKIIAEESFFWKYSNVHEISITSSWFESSLHSTFAFINIWNCFIILMEEGFILSAPLDLFQRNKKRPEIKEKTDILSWMNREDYECIHENVDYTFVRTMGTYFPQDLISNGCQLKNCKEFHFRT